MLKILENIEIFGFIIKKLKYLLYCYSIVDE